MFPELGMSSSCRIPHCTHCFNLYVVFIFIRFSFTLFYLQQHETPTVHHNFCLSCVSQRNNELAQSSVFAQRVAFGIVLSFQRYQQKDWDIPSNIQLMEDESNIVEAGSVALIITTFYDIRGKNKIKQNCKSRSC